MVVAMVSVRVVQMSFDQVVDMVAMRHSFVSTLGAMLVSGIVTIAVVPVRTIGGVLLAYLELVFVNMALVQRVKVPVMQVIGVIVMLNRRVAAVFAMLVWMVGVYNMFIRHC